jgi:hypothetical protein
MCRKHESLVSRACTLRRTTSHNSSSLPLSAARLVNCLIYIFRLLCVFSGARENHFFPVFFFSLLVFLGETANNKKLFQFLFFLLLSGLVCPSQTLGLDCLRGLLKSSTFDHYDIENVFAPSWRESFDVLTTFTLLRSARWIVS